MQDLSEAIDNYCQDKYWHTNRWYVDQYSDGVFKLNNHVIESDIVFRENEEIIE